MTTYKRKYYLHRCVKKSGFTLQLEECAKTIFIPTARTDEAKENKYIKELTEKHQYGAQIVNFQ